MLIAALTLLLLGFALTTRGLIGRRLGDEPRCRKCKYNLTGVESKECPECGREWTVETAARGLRRSRKVSLGVGIAFVATAAGLLTPAARQKFQRTNFYAYMPTAWVIPAAGNGSWNAFRVMFSRYSEHRLSADQCRQVADLALSKQSSAGPDRAAAWIRILDQMRRDGILSDAQQTRFLEQLATFRAEVRPLLRAGDRLPIALIHQSRAPDASEFNVQWDVLRIRIDGVDVSFEDDAVTSSKVPAQSAFDSPAGFLGPERSFSPGRHEVTLEVDSALTRWDPDHHADSPPIWRRTDLLTANFAALPADGSDSLTILTDTNTGEQIRSALTISARISPRFTDGRGPLQIMVFPQKPLPVQCAFNIEIVTPQGARQACGKCESTDSTGRFMVQGPDTPVESVAVGDDISVILTSDPERMRGSTFGKRTWKGELKFAPIRINQWTAPPFVNPDMLRWQSRSAAEALPQPASLSSSGASISQESIDLPADLSEEVRKQILEQIRTIEPPKHKVVNSILLPFEPLKPLRTVSQPTFPSQSPQGN